MSRLFHTVKYLKKKQIIFRVINYFPRLVLQAQTYPSVRIKSNSFFIPRSGITEDYKHFSFLSETYALSEVGWNGALTSKLWRYNLHYFNFLLFKGLPNDKLDLQIGIIEDWIEKNPFGVGIGWEPYPCSLRIINWIKWHWATGRLTKKAKLSLWNQVRWLASRPEYHLLGNHLFINAKALLFANAFFELGFYSSIYIKGKNIINEELSEQFLNDGAHFELSPMYHSLAMEDLLDLISISKQLSNDFPIDNILLKYYKGMSWLQNMSYENEELAHFNDCANEIAPTYSQLVTYASQLGVHRDVNSSKNINFYAKSGFIVFKNKNSHLIVDVGKIGPDYLPGHAHADTLSFELAIKGGRVIVNSGTSMYGESKERLRQRGTSAHSTVEIDGLNSSEVWAGFRVARRASTFNVNVNSNIGSNCIFSMQASHDGYKRLKNKPIHTRSIKLIDNVWKILDYISGTNNTVVSRFYLHPEIQISEICPGIILLKLYICLIKVKYDPKLDLKLVDGTYHDKFGVSRRNKCIQIKSISPCIISIDFEIL